MLFAIAQQEKAAQERKTPSKKAQQEKAALEGKTPPKKAQQEKAAQQAKPGKEPRQAGKPVYFIGVGEGIDDLRPFQPDEFVDALLPSLDDDGNVGAGA